MATTMRGAIMGDVMASLGRSNLGADPLASLFASYRPRDRSSVPSRAPRLSLVLWLLPCRPPGRSREPRRGCFPDLRVSRLLRETRRRLVGSLVGQSWFDPFSAASFNFGLRYLPSCGLKPWVTNCLPPFVPGYAVRVACFIQRLRQLLDRAPDLGCFHKWTFQKGMELSRRGALTSAFAR